MAKNRIQHGSGVYTCVECGKLTRDTGRGEADSDMCVDCFEIAQWINGISDGDFEIKDVTEVYRERVRELLGL